MHPLFFREIETQVRCIITASGKQGPGYFPRSVLHEIHSIEKLIVE